MISFLNIEKTIKVNLSTKDILLRLNNTVEKPKWYQTIYRRSNMPEYVGETTETKIGSKIVIRPKHINLYLLIISIGWAILSIEAITTFNSQATFEKLEGSSSF